MVTPPPATDRTCFHLQDVKGVGLEVFAGGARALVAGEFFDLPEVGLRFPTTIPVYLRLLPLKRG